MGDKQIKRQLRKFKLKNLKYWSLLIKNQLKEYLLQQVISNFLEGFASLNESCVKPWKRKFDTLMLEKIKLSKRPILYTHNYNH